MKVRKQYKQEVYGIWVINYEGYGRWLEWGDVRLGGEPWDPRLGSIYTAAYVFATHRSDLVKVLKYMRGEGLPEHVQEQCDETATANYIYPTNTKSVAIRKCVLPAPGREQKMNIESISAILLTLQVADRQVLFILVAEDGLVNRQGTGAVNNTERDMYIGRHDEPLLAQLRSLIRPEWMAHEGVFDVPDKQGEVCHLSVMFKTSDGRQGGWEFIYGSESQGPPGDICEFVTEAVRLTDPWHAAEIYCVVSIQWRVAERVAEEKTVVEVLVGLVACVSKSFHSW